MFPCRRLFYFLHSFFSIFATSKSLIAFLCAKPRRKMLTLKLTRDYSTDEAVSLRLFCVCDGKRKSWMNWSEISFHLLLLRAILFLIPSSFTIVLIAQNNMKRHTFSTLTRSRLPVIVFVFFFFCNSILCGLSLHQLHCFRSTIFCLPRVWFGFIYSSDSYSQKRFIVHRQLLFYSLATIYSF